MRAAQPIVLGILLTAWRGEATAAGAAPPPATPTCPAVFTHLDHLVGAPISPGELVPDGGWGPAPASATSTAEAP